MRDRYSTVKELIEWAADNRDTATSPERKQAFNEMAEHCSAIRQQIVPIDRHRNLATREADMLVDSETLTASMSRPDVVRRAYILGRTAETADWQIEMAARALFHYEYGDDHNGWWDEHGNWYRGHRDQYRQMAEAALAASRDIVMKGDE